MWKVSSISCHVFSCLFCCSTALQLLRDSYFITYLFFIFIVFLRIVLATTTAVPEEFVARAIASVFAEAV